VDPAARASALEDLLARRGDVLRASVLGSVRNVPGSRFGERGGSATFVRLEYQRSTAILSVLWSDDGHYLGAALGPATNVPAFVLVPRAGGAYTAVEGAAPWRTRDVAFEGECLLVGALRACAEGTAPR
jgi:hypothetical protein